MACRRPTISSHIKKLQDAEIITYSKAGLWVKYKLEENIEKEIMQLLDMLVQILGEDKRIKSDMLMSFKINRKMICKNNKNNDLEVAL